MSYLISIYGLSSVKEVIISAFSDVSYSVHVLFVSPMYFSCSGELKIRAESFSVSFLTGGIVPCASRYGPYDKIAAHVILYSEPFTGVHWSL